MVGSVEHLIETFGGNTAFCRAVGIDDGDGARAYDFKKRNSIPVAYWPGIIEAAARRGVPVDASTLVFIHTGKHVRPPAPPEVMVFCGFAAIVAAMVGFLVGLFLGYMRSLA